MRPSTVARVRRGLYVDSLRWLGRSSFYLYGWAANADERTSFTILARSGGKASLPTPFRPPRGRLDRLFSLLGGRGVGGDTGLIAFFELQPPTQLTGRSRLEARRAGKLTGIARLPAPELDPTENRAAIIRDLVRFRHRRRDLAPHAYPALERLQRSLTDETRMERLAQLGEYRSSPDVSVVVTLDRGPASLEHQLAQFVHDSDVREADLVYVCDYRDFDGGLLESAEDLFSLYRIPFRLVGVRPSASFQAMTNLGAELASGRLLVLLDADVLPDRPGWVAAMSSFLDATPQVGALGPKLLHEDGSVRSAGASLTSSGQLVHRLQGSHRSLPAACETRRVTAVSTACMMLPRKRFAMAGGLRGLHLARDFEGADLCLRLTQLDCESWTLPTVELYHLDEVSRRAMPAETTAGEAYDAWAHRRAWRAAAGEDPGGAS
jgi:hypothetical protein